MPLFKEVVISLGFINLNQLYAHVVETTNYLGCDYKAFHFASIKGVTFQSVIVGKMVWSNIKISLHV